MFGLCIAESYYRLGQCRLEWFGSEMARENARAKLDQSCTTWLHGEPMPKRRQFSVWF